MIDSIPPDCLAFLEQATRDLISEQEIVFGSPDEFQRWATENMSAIARRAKGLQEDLVYVKVLSQPETLAALGEAMSNSVWSAIRAQGEPS